ncbi:hypothetical protein F4678DRAFT_433522 [Xylaria arbuscula]|nr:hypothetical protein F4678DRAFT_433522 [Xylaria arbuscula]
MACLITYIVAGLRPGRPSQTQLDQISLYSYFLTAIFISQAQLITMWIENSAVPLEDDTIKLRSTRDWFHWHLRLKVNASIYGIWKHIDPDGADQSTYLQDTPSSPTAESARKQLISDHHAVWAMTHEEWSKSDPASRDEEPVYEELDPTQDAVDREYEDMLLRFPAEFEMWRSMSNRYLALYNWVCKSVDKRYMDIAMFTVVHGGSRGESHPARNVTRASRHVKTSRVDVVSSTAKVAEGLVLRRRSTVYVRFIRRMRTKGSRPDYGIG